MSEMNLNGRIFGRTADGMILVKLTVNEFLETLPAAFSTVAELEKAPDPVTVIDRKPGKATPAQRKFNGKPDSRTCESCGKSFMPRRKDQTCCNKVCRTRLSNALTNARRKPAKSASQAAPAVFAPTPAAKLTPEQKRERLDVIRSKLRKIDDRPARSGSFSSSEEPAELTQARRESTDVEF